MGLVPHHHPAGHRKSASLCRATTLKHAQAMSPPDVHAISDYYRRLLAAFQHGTRFAVEQAVNVILGGCDAFIVSKAVGWAVEYVLKKVGWDPKSQALCVALRCEYVKRSGSHRQAWNLTNKCSRCGCIGHNRQNHSSQIDQFLQVKGLADAAEESIQFIREEVEEDGWWSWLNSGRDSD